MKKITPVVKFVKKFSSSMVIKRKIMFVRFFREALPLICGKAEA